MGVPNTNTAVNNYQFGSGNLFFNPLVAGVYQGLQTFGNTTGFTVTVTSETLKHTNFQSAARETDLEIPLSTERTAQITSDNLSAFNVRLFWSGTETTITQAATPIVSEVIGPITANSAYRLGKTTANPAGAYNIGSVVVRIKEGDDAPDRVNSATYVAGDTYVPATPNSHWYMCTVGGAAAGSPPTFNVAGSTHADGAATFQDMGLIIVASTANVNYRIDTTYALLSVTPAGTIAVANTLWATINTGEKLSLHVDYTPVAGTREMIKTGAGGSLSGELVFIADNTNGTNRDVTMPSVTLAPNGELPYINDGEFASVGFTVGIGKLNSDTEAMYSTGPLVAS